MLLFLAHAGHRDVPGPDLAQTLRHVPRPPLSPFSSAGDHFRKCPWASKRLYAFGVTGPEVTGASSVSSMNRRPQGLRRQAKRHSRPRPGPGDVDEEPRPSSLQPRRAQRPGAEGAEDQGPPGYRSSGRHGACAPPPAHRRHGHALGPRSPVFSRPGPGQGRGPHLRNAPPFLQPPSGLSRSAPIEPVWCKKACSASRRAFARV